MDRATDRRRFCHVSLGVGFKSGESRVNECVTFSQRGVVVVVFLNKQTSNPFEINCGEKSKVRIMNPM